MTAQFNQSESLSLKEKIEQIVLGKLKPIQIERGFLYVKEVAVLLNCTDRTLRRWNKQRLEGNKQVGIEFHQDNVKAPCKYYFCDICQYFINNAI